MIYDHDSNSIRDNWHGQEKIVLSIDLGTTSSAVAFAHLAPGEPPVIRVVTKWPGQEDASGDSKVPSLVAYDRGNPIAFGAEALDFLESEGIDVVRWFKLHLHPDYIKDSAEPPVYDSTTNASLPFELPELPETVSLKKVYSDFLGYLYTHGAKVFKETMVDGQHIWDKLSNRIHICLTTPNGWEGRQQAFLREACVQGGLLPTSHEEERLRFVTEGEASVHYALHYTNTQHWLYPGTVFAVTDAGGSTVDSTLYECKEIKPKLKLEEVCASECVQAGAVFVDREAQKMISAKLLGSKFDNPTTMLTLMQEFERKTKRKFDGSQNSNIIRFGHNWDNDRERAISSGRLTLTKDEVSGTFKEVVPRIISSCARLLRERNTKHLLLVGGFGESGYLRNQLKAAFSSQEVNIITIDNSTKKAASEGAALWYIKQTVAARASRTTYGAHVQSPYRKNNPIHRQREGMKFVDLDGVTRLDGLFDTWVRKDEVVNENTTKVVDYTEMSKDGAFDLKNHTMDILAFDGTGDCHWALDRLGNPMPHIRRVCTISADLSGLKYSMVQQKRLDGKKYWRIDYSIVIYFGGTSLRAKLVWTENGKRKEGPVSVIPNSIT